MTDYWKSNDRKYCDFCKCWLSDNKASIDFHENGKRHKMSVAKRLAEISKNSSQAELAKKKMDLELRKMEDAAMRSYAQDIHSGGDLTARTLSAVINATSSNNSVAGTSREVQRSLRQVDPMRLPGNSDDEDERVDIKKVSAEEVPNASLWVEGKSDEGHVYYWNVKTNESVWEAPAEGYLTYVEYQRINELAVQQQEMHAAEEAKHFRESANEMVARYNRERLKVLRRPEKIIEEKAKEEKRNTFKTEEESLAPAIGEWQVVQAQPPAAPVNLELPQINYFTPLPNICTAAATEYTEPAIKRFKEKVVGSLDPEFACNAAPTFKKRKFAAKKSMRQRLDD